jgi:membrane-associated phospholipid phosphatase
MIKSPDMGFLFDPEFNEFLQSFRSPLLTGIMLMISALGSTLFLNTGAALVLFGFHFRKGLLMLHALLWTSLLSDTLKQIFRMPRPTDVGAAVTLLENDYPEWLLELFPLGMNYGLPSGHVSSTTVFWGLIMLLFRRKAFTIAGCVLIFLMPFSRIYLGRHFLGDVIGGFLLAGVVLFVVFQLFLRKPSETPLYSGARNSNFLEKIPDHNVLLAFYVFPVLASPVFAAFHSQNTGKLLGLALASLLLILRGMPAESKGGSHSVARFSLAAILFLTVRIAFLATIGTEQTGLTLLIEVFSVVLAIWGTIELSVKIGLYKRA